MHTSVRVGDYFGNDDNGLWSWYLTNIRNGDFEELTGNRLKHSLFTRFLRTHLDPVFNTRKDTKVLIVSISEAVRRSDTTLLELFLHDYLHLDNMEITKLSTSSIYNHENHYVVMDKENNFKSSEFLGLGHSEVSANLPVKKDGKINDTEATGPIQKDTRLESPMKFEITSEKESSEDMEGDESLIIDFSPNHGYRQSIPNSSVDNTSKKELVGKHQPFEDKSQVAVTGNNDEGKLDGYPPEKDSSPMMEDFKRQPLTLTMTGTEAGFSSSDEYDSMDSSHSSRDTDLSSYDERSLTSILPSISIEDSFGHFRLVLQSILFMGAVHNEIFTAIRQSNNKPTKASIDDDWLLYDSQFSMHNLQMLTLQDLSELNEGCPKVLFYSLVEVFETPLEDVEHDVAVPNVASTTLTGTLTGTTVSHEPRGFFPSGLNSAGTTVNHLKKDNTNGSTIGHGSVVTTTSAADLGGHSMTSYGTGTPMQRHDHTLKSKVPGVSRSDAIMGRTRSSPLPTNLETGSSHGRRRTRKWGGRFVNHGNKNTVTHFADHKGCVIC